MKIIKIILAVFILFYFFVITGVGIDPDLGWHLRIGQEIAQTGSVPQYDDLTHTMPGHEWVDHEWIINRWFYQMRGIWPLMILLFSALAAIPFIYWIKRSSNWWQLAAIFAVAVSFSAFLFVRPAVISFFLFAWLYDHLNANFYLLNVKNKQKWPSFAVLVLFFWFWSGLHAGFVQGLFLLGLFYAHYYLMAYRHDSGSRSEFLRDPKLLAQFYFDCFTIFCCVMVTLLHPYGIGLWQEVLRIMTSSETHKYISEWLPGLISANWIGIFFWLPLAWVLFRYKYFIDHQQGFIALIFLTMFLMSQRQFMPLVIVGLPVLIKGLEFAYKEKGKDIARNFAIICIIVFCFLSALGSIKERQAVNYYPLRTIDTLKTYAKYNDLVLFNDYGWGGLLSWKAPEIKYLMDGRMPHWKMGNWSLLEDYMQAYYFGNNIAQAKLINTFGINAALLNNKVDPNTGDSLKDYLLKKNWKILSEDNLSVFMVAP